MPLFIWDQISRQPPTPRLDCQAEREAVEIETLSISSRCGVAVPDDQMFWRCSRRRGHKGQHIAAYSRRDYDRPNGGIVARWGWED